MNITKAIETKSTYKGKLHEKLFCQALIVIFFPITPDIENLLAVFLDCYTIGQRQPLILEFIRRKLIEIELAVNFINRIILVLWPSRGLNASQLLLLLFDLIRKRILRQA